MEAEKHGSIFANAKYKVLCCTFVFFFLEFENSAIKRNEIIEIEFALIDSEENLVFAIDIEV